MIAARQHRVNVLNHHRSSCMWMWKDRRAPVAATIAIVCCCGLGDGASAAQPGVDDHRPLIVLADLDMFQVTADSIYVRRAGGGP
jgi:hypothetical protein